MLSGIATTRQGRSLQGADPKAVVEDRASDIEQLVQSQLFAGLSTDQVAGVHTLCRKIHGRAGQTVFCEGDEPSVVLVVLTGEVAVEVKLLRNPQVRPKGATLEKVGPGGVIGCCALSRSPACISARCTQDTQMAAFEAGALRAWLADHPRAGVVVMENAFKTACQRLVLARQELLAQFGLSEMYQTHRNY